MQAARLLKPLCAQNRFWYLGDGVLWNALAWGWGFVWLVAASVAGWPWVNGLRSPLARPASGVEVDPEIGGWPTIRWPLTIGLSLGALTLWMLAIGFWRLTVWGALAFPLAVYISGHLLFRRTLKQSASSLNYINVGVRRAAQKLRAGDARAWIALLGLGVLGVVLGHSTYYPFTADDEISRYAYYARLIFTRHQITADVRGYPMFLPLAYAYVFFITGQVAEQLARMIPALLSAMTVIATGALALRWYGARAGWGAAAALLATPLYVHWSPDGYIDIPSALFFVLCAYAADVWLNVRQVRWAALAGVLAGLAMWMKQAGFLALACLGVLFAVALVRDLVNGKRGEWAMAVRDGLVALGMATLAGGMWYLRNAYYDGWGGAVPDPGVFYYQQARNDWSHLIPFVGEFSVFGGIASLMFLAGLAWAAVRLKQAVWPLVWALPYTLLWWRLFSYDARFLLTVLPFYAVLFGGLVAEVKWSPAGWARWIVVGALVSAVGVSLYQAKLGGLRRWIVAPTATYEEKLIRAKGDLYPTVKYVLDHVPPTAKIVSMDGRMEYYLIDRSMDIAYPTSWAELTRYDYFVAGSWAEGVYAGLGAADNEVARELRSPQRLEQVYVGPQGGLTVYRILKP